MLVQYLQQDTGIHLSTPSSSPPALDSKRIPPPSETYWKSCVQVPPAFLHVNVCNPSAETSPCHEAAFTAGCGLPKEEGQRSIKKDKKLFWEHT